LLHYSYVHTSVGKAHDVHGGVGGDSILRYDATSLDDQFMDVPKEPRAFVFQGVNFFSTDTGR